MLRLGAALAVMGVSGFAGLGYQVVWTQQGALWLGHEAAAVLAVVAAFFGGLGLGALLLGQRIEHSPHPARWYAACEALIGAWSLLLAFALAPASAWLQGLGGAQPSPLWQWTVAFAGTFALLLPATAAMGATLPAMERVLAGLARQAHAPVGALYAANTFGAVLGVLGTAFWLVPAQGLTRTALLCAALNLACAAATPWLFRGAPPARPPLAMRQDPARVLWTLACTGLLGIGYEVLVVRVLGQVAQNTVYTFALLLAVYLVGSALGAAAHQRWARAADASRLGPRLTALLAASCLAEMLVLPGTRAVRDAALHALGEGWPAALGAEAAVAALAFLLPTCFMGALFSHLASQARAAGVGLGRALGVNTLGAACAPLLFGVGLVPLLGTTPALLLVGAGYLLLLPRPAWRRPVPWGLAGAALALALWAPPLAFVDLPEGGRLLSLREGALGTVSVVQDAQGVASLHIDNREQEGSSATLYADARQALLPLLLHPAPRRALFLGVGTGVTASAAAHDPLLQVDAVELVPEVIEATRHFTPDGEGQAPTPPRPRLLAADARRYVRATDTRYDLVVADNFHPARSGSGSLYTVEHFQAVRARLAAGGLFCQWLPLHQLDLPTLRSIVRSYLAVYPRAWALLATNSLETPVLGLVARADGQRFDADLVRERLAGAAAVHHPDDFGLPDDDALLGSFVAGPRALARWADGAEPNTDDRPVVAYAAPRLSYAPDSTPRERLLALLDVLAPAPGEPALTPGELLRESPDTAAPARLQAYWSARNRFLVAGRDVRPVGDARRMLAQVREPLLAVLRASPEFRPAYDPLLRLAAALADTDPDAARALLTELQRLQPARPEASEALQALGGAAR
jgi:spermidine synthase